jgi:hypothetical protein
MLAANYLAFVQLASIRLWLRVNEFTPSRLHRQVQPTAATLAAVEKDRKLLFIIMLSPGAATAASAAGVLALAQKRGHRLP